MREAFSKLAGQCAIPCHSKPMPSEKKLTHLVRLLVDDELYSWLEGEVRRTRRTKSDIVRAMFERAKDEQRTVEG